MFFHTSESIFVFLQDEVNALVSKADNNFFDDENNAIVLFPMRPEFYVWILESGNGESLDVLSWGSSGAVGDSAKSVYFVPILQYRLIGAVIRDGVFDSDLGWRRLIRSVLQQSLAKLKSSMGLIS